MNETQDQLRCNIVTSGTKVFLEKGYRSVTIEDFAEAAGVAPDIITETIGQKEDLIALIVRFVTLEVKAEIFSVMRAHKTTEEFLLAVAKNYLVKICDRNAIKGFQSAAGLATDFPHISMQFRATAREGNEEFAEILEAETDITLPEGYDYQDAAAQFFALCRGAFHHQLVFDIEYVVSDQEISAQAEKAVATFLSAFPIKTA